MPRYLHIPHTPDTARTLTLSGRNCLVVSGIVTPPKIDYRRGKGRRGEMCPQGTQARKRAPRRNVSTRHAEVPQRGCCVPCRVSVRPCVPHRAPCTWKCPRCTPHRAPCMWECPRCTPHRASCTWESPRCTPHRAPCTWESPAMYPTSRSLHMGKPSMYPTSQAMHMGKPRDVPHRERYSNSNV